jgi:hypothetical protein
MLCDEALVFEFIVLLLALDVGKRNKGGLIAGAFENAAEQTRNVIERRACPLDDSG